MTRFRLKYTHEFIDRTGKLRRYVRPPRHPATPLPGAPGSAEFMSAYHTALAAAATVAMSDKAGAAGNASMAIGGEMVAGEAVEGEGHLEGMELSDDKSALAAAFASSAFGA